MDFKENVAPEGFTEPLRLTTKLNMRSTSISNFSSDIEAEKEYLIKLKTQRQKTEKLHAEYIKLKKEKDSLQGNYEDQMACLESKILELEADVSKKCEENKETFRQNQRLRTELDRMSRQKNQSLNKLKCSYDETFLELRNNIDILTESAESKSKALNSLKKAHSLKVKQLQTEITSLQQQNKVNISKCKITEDRLKEFEKNSTDWQHRVETQEYEINRLRTDCELKTKEINGMKSNSQRIQMEYQTNLRKFNSLEDHIATLEQKVSFLERQKEKLKDRNNQLMSQITIEKSERSKIETTIKTREQETTKIRQELYRKQEIIKQYQTRVLNHQEQQKWKQRLADKEYENEELLEAIRTLKEENNSLMSFIKQRQALEKERRSLVENEMEEISKFETLLRDVN